MKEKAKNRATSVETDFDLTQEDNVALYSGGMIKKFHEDIKGVRQTVVWEHFLDYKVFVNSAKPVTRKFGEVLTDQEIHRLKYIGKARVELNEGKKELSLFFVSLMCYFT